MADSRNACLALEIARHGLAQFRDGSLFFISCWASMLSQ
jgi:hypothetical protein